MSDSVEFRHLEYLLAIYERKNFTKVAERVYRSQPEVSQQVRALEEDVGFPIFIRGGRNGVFPTSPSDLAPVEIIGRTGRIIEHVDRALEAKLEEFQISRASFDVLVALRRNGKPYQLTQRELMRSPLPYLRKHESQDRLSGEARFCGAETGYRRSAIRLCKTYPKGHSALRSSHS